jgi:hypothetical protein
MLFSKRSFFEHQSLSFRGFSSCKPKPFQQFELYAGLSVLQIAARVGAVTFLPSVAQKYFVFWIADKKINKKGLQVIQIFFVIGQQIDKRKNQVSEESFKRERFEIRIVINKSQFVLIHWISEKFELQREK